MKLFSLSTLSLALLGVAPSIHAQIVQFDFTDTNSQQKSIIAASTSYLNPAGQLNVLTVAGLDRKVQLTIKNAAGTSVFDKTSTLVTVTDRLTDKNGTGFYGKSFAITSLAEGNYTATSKVMDINGNTVSSNSYTLKVDTTAPSSDAITEISGGYGMVRTGDVWLLSRGGAEDHSFVVNNITDGSGIASVIARTYRENGTLYASKDPGYDSTNKTSSISTETGGLVPANTDLDETFTLQFVITDTAGNVTVKQQLFKYDNYVAPVSLVGVYDPDFNGQLLSGLTGFTPYVAGMTVKTNPIKLAFRIKKTDYYKYNPGGLKMTNGLGSINDTVEDDTYVYVQATAPYGNVDGNHWRWVNFGEWGGRDISYNLVLSPNAKQSPKLLGIQYNYSDIGWSSSSRTVLQNSVMPLTIDGIKILAEARTYPQVATHMGNCTIPAGETSCIISYQTTIKNGTTGYLHSQAVIWDDAHTLMSNPTWGDVDYNDYYYPEITYKYDEATQKLVQFVTQPGRGSYFDRLNLKSVWLENANNNNTPVSLSPTKLSESEQYYSYEWDLGKLPDGNYSLVAVAKENHGPVTRLPLFALSKDNQAPVITITGGAGNSIESLKDILVSVVDNTDQSPEITSVSLTGGPINESLTLGFSKQSDGYYHIESPRMFPSLDDTQRYTLTVTAKDAQNNTSKTTKIFLLTPENLVTLGTIKGLGVNKVLKDKNDQPLTYAKITTVKTSAGATATGAQQAYFTLRRDAAFAVVVNNVTVQPGETKEFTLTLDNTGGAVLPIYPAVNDTTGDASFMIDIPQLIVN